MSKFERQKFERDPARAEQAMQTLGKWRSVFTGWFLGTRLNTDEQSQAYRDLQEARLMMRAELSAAAALLMEKGVFTHEEFYAQVGVESELLSKSLEERFPGMKATPDGISYDARAAETMKGWPA